MYTIRKAEYNLTDVINLKTLKKKESWLGHKCDNDLIVAT